MGDSEAPETEKTYVPQFTNKFFINATKEDNVVVSPLSAEIVLAMAYQGTAGETAERFTNILNIANQKDAADKYRSVLEKLTSLTDVTLDIANKIFIMEGFPLKYVFKSVLQEFFMSRADSVDFADNQKAADEINQWVENKTHNKIKDLISASSLNGMVRLVLANAVYFKGLWANPFNEEDTSTEPFFMSDEETVDCEMMFITDDFNLCRYHDELHASLLELPYEGDRVSMIIILPKDYDGITKLENDLLNVDLSTLMQKENAHVDQVEVSLPKFKIELTTDLKPLLEKMGLEVIFDPRAADFSEISEKPEGLYVSQIVQKAFIEVNEKGTEAGAASGCSFRRLSGPSRFVADHPFVFVLQAHGENGNTVLFIGKVLNPSK